MPNIAVARWQGFCPICSQSTEFVASDTWFRDFLLCTSCDTGSLPRERALMLAITQMVPHWATLDIHESSPSHRGVSQLLATEASGYIPTHFWPDVTPGDRRHGTRCENLEAQTFEADSFDLVLSQDVMEHVWNPEKAYREVYRTLRPGGLYIHTTPIYKHMAETVQAARLEPSGEITHLMEPEYHGNPINGDGSLVTYRFGYDLGDLIARWTRFDVEIRRYNHRTFGIVAEFTEVIICTKPG